MSEFRIDPISGELTIIATERANRPQDFNTTKSNVCPFCPGNEQMTPKPILQKSISGLNNWDLRIVPNKYPFISEKSESQTNDNFYNKIAGYGYHDVLIDTPNHNESIFEFSNSHMENIFLILQERQKQIEEDKKIKYVHIFKNNGNQAGASKEHSHWQIVGLPIIPENQFKLITGNKKYIKEKGICGYCDIINHELEFKEHLITENESFVAITPYASKFPYEIWIIPKSHRESFLIFDNTEIKDMAKILTQVLKSLKTIFKNLNFNLCFMGNLNVENYKGVHHFYLQIIPRITGLAGFELGTSCYIDIYSPELAAQALKQNLY